MSEHIIYFYIQIIRKKKKHREEVIRVSKYPGGIDDEVEGNSVPVKKTCPLSHYVYVVNMCTLTIS